MGYPIADEATLLANIQKGDTKAWDAVVQVLYTPLFHFVYEIVRNSQVAEELVQDVFVNFWLKRESITVTSSLKAYLYRAARNHTLNFIKRRKFEQDYQQQLAQRLPVQHNETEESLAFSELEQRLTEAIDSLPDSCRDIFKLSRYEELSYKEIAEVLSLTPRNVHYQIGLALKELRQKLHGYLPPSMR